MSKDILILTPFYPPNIGGAETFIEGLCNQAKKFFNITVLTFQPFEGKAKSKEEYCCKEGSLKIYRQKWWVKPCKVWRGVTLKNALLVIPSMVFKCILLCRKNNYQIIHAQGLLSGFVAVFLKKIFKVKVFITLLALYEFPKMEKKYPMERLVLSLSRWTFKNADVIFVEGENGKKDIECFEMDSKVREFNHWCDQNIFRPPHTRDTSKVRILFCGRPIPEKGRHILEGAERYLDKEKYEFLYVENVEYRFLPKLYQMADIVVVPSLYAEGFSRVVAESACCGCAVIVSNHGSLPEQVRGWGTIYDGTTEGLVKALQKINFKDRGEDAYSRAKDNFNSKNSGVFLNEYANN